ncbi:MAG TPA: PRC-barrel domain-containing protein [Clostridiales bacterium]|nr:PRC-barrel domain-containing protein [Clostridiales bacterium]
MKRITDILGLAVIFENGKKNPGIIKDVIFNIEEKQIKAFNVEKPGINNSTRLILFQDVCEIGENAVIISDEAEAKATSRKLINYTGGQYTGGQSFTNYSERQSARQPGRPFAERQNDRKYSHIDKKIEEVNVYSKSGKDLGIVKDILFDCKTGYIEGFELTDGLIQDIIEGRKVVPLIGKYEYGKDYLLVGNDIEQEITTTGGGLRKKFLRIDSVYVTDK